MIVIDTSSLVGAALKVGSVPERALLWVAANDRFALSSSVIAEFVDVFARPKVANAVGESRRTSFVQLILDGGKWFSPLLNVTDCRDAGDNKFLELALAANAECIVSSDNDLRILNPWRGIPIVSPAEFLASR